MSAALKVPKNTVASIILKWKKFGTTQTLLRGLYGRVGRQLLSKKYMKARLEFPQKAPKELRL
jgi:hypothetical protein